MKRAVPLVLVAGSSIAWMFLATMPGRAQEQITFILPRTPMVGYNDKFWFDRRGTPHTEQLHTIERWTRPNFGPIVNEFTIDDPGAYSRPVQLHFTATHVRPDIDLLEFICKEDNQYGIAGGFTPGQTGK